MRDHPITAVSEPFQYRAIGLVRGIYRPENSDHFTKGSLIDQQGVEIESVVLGRVLTLMKKHVSIEEAHLWVVYPRCRNENKLHLQIAGIWEPSTLTLGKEERIDYNDSLIEGDDYFSIRGELIYTKPDTNDLIVKIRQQPRKGIKKTLPFKLRLKGNIPTDKLHQFISLDVRRSGEELKIEKFESIGPVMVKGERKGNRSKVTNTSKS